MANLSKEKPPKIVDFARILRLRLLRTESPEHERAEDQQGARDRPDEGDRCAGTVLPFRQEPDEDERKGEASLPEQRLQGAEGGAEAAFDPLLGVGAHDRTEQAPAELMDREAQEHRR